MYPHDAQRRTPSSSSRLSSYSSEEEERQEAERRQSVGSHHRTVHGPIASVRTPPTADELGHEQPPFVYPTVVTVPSSGPSSSPHQRHEHPSRGRRRASSAASGRNRSPSRTPLIQLTSWIFRHTKSIQLWLAFATVLLFILINTIISNTHHASDFHTQGAHRDIIDKFRNGIDPDGIGTRYELFQSVIGTYKQADLFNVEPSEWPPSVRCPMVRELSDTNGYTNCLLDVYFRKEEDEYPTLFQFRAGRDEDRDCKEKLIIDIVPNGLQKKVSPGRMLREYLSLMGFAGKNIGYLLHSGSTLYDPHPYWPWASEVHPPTWQWDKISNDTLQQTNWTSDPPDSNRYDLGEFFMFRHWEMDRTMLNYCLPEQPFYQYRLRYDHPVGLNADGYLLSLNASRTEITQLIQRVDQIRPPTPEQPVYKEPDPIPVGALFKEMESGVITPARPNRPPPPPKREGFYLVLPGWHAPLLDEKMLLVMEIRLWSRWATIRSIYALIGSTLLPDMYPKNPWHAWHARMENRFITPETLDHAIKSEMMKGYWMNGVRHGFDMHAHIAHEANPKTFKLDKWTPKVHSNPIDTYNTWSGIFDMYYKNMLHVALVIKQRLRIRKIFDPSNPEPSHPASSSASDTSSGYFRSSYKFTPHHMNIGVPVQYMDQVVNLEAIFDFFNRTHAVLPALIKNQLILTIYFDGIGLTEHDLQPFLRKFYSIGVQARLQLNTPLATQVQQIAFSDIQMYFCLEESLPQPSALKNVPEDLDDQFELGTCCMSAFLRSEPLKLIFHSSSLPTFYPYVRNVMRMELQRSNYTTLLQLKQATSQVRIVDLGRHNGNDTLRHQLALRHHYPSLPTSQTRMIYLRDLASHQRIRFHPSALPPPSSTTSPPSAIDSTEFERASANEFRRQVERVYARKLRFLRREGAPIFRENYRPDFPAHLIIQP